MVAISGPVGPIYNWTTGKGYVTGQYYGPTIGGFSATPTTLALANTDLVFMPFVPDVTRTFPAISVYNTSAAESGNKARLGVYSSTNGQPSALLVDAGEITLTGAAAIRDLTATIALSVGRLYFTCIHTNAAFTVRALTPGAGGTEASIRLGQPSSNLASAANLSATFYANQAYGALPSTPPTLTTAGYTTVPFVCVKG